MSIRRALFAALLLLSAVPAGAVGTTLTYQGTLEDAGAPANGTYDFQFRVVSSGGTQISGALQANDVAVTGGVFTVQLDFGPGIFTGADRLLEIGVRPGSSIGAYTVLSPNTPFNATPYAQFANQADAAATASTANDVIDDAINSIDIAPGAVGSSDIADGAVTVNKIASGSLTMSRFAGAFGNYAITATIPGNSCGDFNVTFGGDVDTDDFPIVAMGAGASLPNNMSVTALRVSAANIVELRICNAGSGTASFSNLAIKLITLR
jgi:hypothetical protein